ncbi:MAG: hypothetical protein ACK559_04295, partial [bacterium]
MATVVLLRAVTPNSPKEASSVVSSQALTAGIPEHGVNVVTVKYLVAPPVRSYHPVIVTEVSTSETLHIAFKIASMSAHHCR